MRPALLVLLASALVAPADDSRERRARVALALSARPPSPAAAPAPRPAAKSYPDGHAKAIERAEPLVVFVGCQSWPVEGAIVARAEAPFAGVRGPAVVVGYPTGDRLYIDSTLPPDPARVAEAVRAAQKKIEAPPAKHMPPAPKPLNWDL